MDHKKTKRGGVEGEMHPTETNRGGRDQKKRQRKINQKKRGSKRV